MIKNWERQEIIQLLSLSGTLAGLCITALTVFRATRNQALAVSVTDDVLALSALIFLLATFLFFFSLRLKNDRIAVFFEKTGDLFFLLALSGMVLSGFVMVYTIW